MHIADFSVGIFGANGIVGAGMPIANGVARHPIPSISFVIAVVIASFWAARGLSINSTMLETFDPSHPTVKSLHLVEDKPGILPIELSASRRADFRIRRVLKVGNFRFAKQQEAVLSRSRTSTFTATSIPIANSPRRSMNFLRTIYIRAEFGDQCRRRTAGRRFTIGLSRTTTASAVTQRDVGTESR
jgi:hypothetical protein